ncbi:hypothetical protein OEG84_11500 [Hoeflea sp. G2-23]|uniref:Uncharacterized protein n=1 Tax=Hoeflea algicola TaxID=2983763 RepID=A0ABT3Z977_9HYPH|nr:hypothetical protein [Hoeflea algicola]MCY0148318.1 hypothetical protein [Hoeflea algicola]
MSALLARLIPGFNWLTIGVGVVAGALLAALPVYTMGRIDGKALSELKPLKQVIQDIRDRNTDDAETQRLSDFDVCVRDFGRVPECDALK